VDPAAEIASAGAASLTFGDATTYVGFDSTAGRRRIVSTTRGRDPVWHPDPRHLRDRQEDGRQTNSHSPADAITVLVGGALEFHGHSAFRPMNPDRSTMECSDYPFSSKYIFTAICENSAGRRKGGGLRRALGFGLEVAVDDLHRVRRREAAPGLDEGAEQRPPAARLLSGPRAQRHALDQLHDQQPLTGVLAQFVDLDDVGVRQAGQRARLGHHPPAVGRRPGGAAQAFDREPSASVVARPPTAAQRHGDGRGEARDRDARDHAAHDAQATGRVGRQSRVRALGRAAIR